jgi:hypothetical protein
LKSLEEALKEKETVLNPRPKFSFKTKVDKPIQILEAKNPNQELGMNQKISTEPISTTRV